MQYINNILSIKSSSKILRLDKEATSFFLLFCYQNSAYLLLLAYLYNSIHFHPKKGGALVHEVQTIMGFGRVGKIIHVSIIHPAQLH